MKALNYNQTQTAVALFLKADVVPFIFGHQDGPDEREDAHGEIKLSDKYKGLTKEENGF